LLKDILEVVGPLPAIALLIAGGVIWHLILQCFDKKLDTTVKKTIRSELGVPKEMFDQMKSFLAEWGEVKKRIEVLEALVIPRKVNGVHKEGR
jgi:hypothetical protein